MSNPRDRTQDKHSPVWDRLPKPLKGIRALLAGVVLTAAVTGICSILVDGLPAHGVAMLYILGVVAAAVAVGTKGGIAAAISAFLAFNYFFLQPTYTFTISDPRDLIALLVFFGVAISTGSLAGRLREVAEQARQNARSLESLNALASRLSAATGVEAVADALTSQASRLSAAPAVVLRVEKTELTIITQVHEAPPLSTADWQAASRCVSARQAVYPAALGWPGSRYEFRPVIARDEVVAVLGVYQANNDDANDATLNAMVKQAAIALERLSFEAEKNAAEKDIEAERLRAALLSSVSHDIKTPLASIQGAVTSLRELGHKMPEETKADLLLAIDEEAARLSRFVTKLLDMVRLQSGPSDMVKDWIDLNDTLGATVARARKSMPGARIRMDVADTAPAMIRADETLVEHILLNVIENAFNFSPADTEINVKMRAVRDGTQVQVEDTGAGIAPADLPRVFDKFFRGSGAKVHGSGLGLTICQEVMKALGGTITVDSPIAHSRGTRVTLFFPEGSHDKTDGATT